MKRNPSQTWAGRGLLPGLAQGAALGCAWAVLAAFLGEVRAGVPLLLTLIGLGAGLGAFPVTRRILAVSSGAAAVLLLTPALRAPLAALTLAQPPAQADAIVVLGAGVQCGTRTLDTHSLARLVRGLELWRAGYAPTLTVSEQSGVLGPPDCVKLSALERAHIRALYPQGGPEVLTLPSVTTTRDEAARVRDLARTRGWTRVLLVTSPSHSRRAARLLTSTAPGLTVLSVPAGETRFDATLPLPADRLAAARVLLYEGLSRVKAGLGGTPER